MAILGMARVAKGGTHAHTHAHTKENHWWWRCVCSSESLQYDEVFRSIWLECKFLTVENFESKSFAGLSIDFCRFDGDREQTRVLHSERPFQSEVWLFHFCFWNKKNRDNQKIQLNVSKEEKLDRTYWNTHTHSKCTGINPINSRAHCVFGYFHLGSLINT